MKNLTYTEVIALLVNTDFEINLHCGVYSIYNKTLLEHAGGSPILASGTTPGAAYEDLRKYLRK